MRYVKFIVLVTGIFVSLHYAAAQASPPATAAGTLPDSVFYIFDRLFETIRELLTFNPEAKVKLEVAFAAERVAEIDVLLTQRGVEAPGLDVAKARLESHMHRAATILESEKGKGKDVGALANDTDDAFDADEKELSNAFTEREKALEARKDALETRVEEAQRAGDTALVAQLEAELVAIEAEEKKLDADEEALEQNLKDDEDKIEKQLEPKDQEEERLEEEQDAAEKAAKDIRDLEKDLRKEIPEEKE